VVEALSNGPLRFAELQQLLPGMATNVLSSRLRQLEAARVVAATPYSQRPLRFAYQLTPAGSELARVARLLAQWEAQVAEGGAGLARHRACGTPMELRWFCPSCQELSGVQEPAVLDDRPSRQGKQRPSSDLDTRPEGDSPAGLIWV